jgi:hypothetical protein
VSSDTSFTKLFSSITKSTVWCEPAGTRLVWITMLADCDRRGEVHASIPGLANLARVTVVECEAAIATFLAPDPYSRTPDHEGRRIEPIPGGWRMLNYDLYRGKKDEGAVREQKREHMRRVRAEEEMNATSGNGISTVGNGVAQKSTISTCGDIAEAEADTEKSNSKSRARPAPLALPGWLPADAWQDWHEYRNSRKGWTGKARELSLRTLTELWAQGFDPRAVIEQSIEKSWTGLFPIRLENSRGTDRKLSAVERVEARIEQNRAERGDIEGTATHVTD